MRRLLVALAGGALLASLVGPIAAAESQPLDVEVLGKGSSSLLGVRKAKQAVPVSGMHAASRSQVQGVLKNLSIYRKMPEIRCEADPRVVTYFLDNPEVAVGIWRVLGVSDVRMSRTGPHSFVADDGQGSRGNISVVYRDARQHVILCDGTFLNPVNRKPIQAKAVIHFRHRNERTRDGRIFSRQDATMFVSLPSSGVEAVARAISPVSNKLADRNFVEVSQFIRLMSVAMNEQPHWMQSVSSQLGDVTPAVRGGLLKLAGTMHAEHRQKYGDQVRTAGRPGGVVR